MGKGGLAASRPKLQRRHSFAFRFSFEIAFVKDGRLRFSFDDLGCILYVGFLFCCEITFYPAIFILLFRFSK